MYGSENKAKLFPHGTSEMKIGTNRISYFIIFHLVFAKV